MYKLNVVAGDSRDTSGRKRFFPFVPEHHLIPGTLFFKYQQLKFNLLGHIPKKGWYTDYLFYPEVCQTIYFLNPFYFILKCLGGRSWVLQRQRHLIPLCNS